MRRVLHISSGLLAVAFLLLIVISWRWRLNAYRSLSVDWTNWNNSQRPVLLQVFRGSVTFERPAWDFGGSSDGGWGFFVGPPAWTASRNAEPWWHLGAGYSNDHDAGYVTIPLWPVVLLFALPPLLALRHRRVAARAATGLCRHCGYDLRASSGRCPECGTPIHISSAVGA